MTRQRIFKLGLLVMRSRLGIIVILGAVAGWAICAYLPSRLLHVHLREEVVKAENEKELVGVIWQAAEFGDAGVILLVEKLDAESPAVATAARDALLDQVRRWGEGPPDEAADHYRQLIAHLRAGLHSFRVPSRRAVAEVCEEILIWYHDRADSTYADLLRACGDITEATHDGRSRRSLSADTIGRRVIAERSWVRPKTRNEFPESRELIPLATIPSSSSNGNSHVPGGGLKIEPVAQTISQHRNQGASSELAASGSGVNWPARLTGHNRLAIIDTPELSAAGRDTEYLAAAVNKRPATTPADLLSPAVLADATRLHAPAEDIRQSALQRLADQGFSPENILLLSRLVDPNPRARASLIDELPVAGDLDAVPWILHLSQDKDARVRLAAAGFMTLNSEPAYIERLDEMLQADPDVRVRVQIELSRRMKSNDLSERVELVQRLFDLPTVNPIPWLLRLSQDSEVAVRKAALSAMATANDPTLVERMRQMRVVDDDAEIRQMAATYLAARAGQSLE